VSEPEVKRGPGRPRKEQPFTPGGGAGGVTATDTPDFDLQAAVLAGVRKSFPDGELSMKQLDESEDKLSFRRLVAQLRVKVTLGSFAVTTLIPADADQSEVDAAMMRLRTDKREIERHIAKFTPDGIAPAGTRD
jgi:hypothetical protein